MDELSQLDELIESDILEALGQDVSESIQNKADINIEDLENESPDTEEDAISIEDLDQVINPSDDIDLQDVEPLHENVPKTTSQNTSEVQKVDATVNSTDLASLISQLLTNKTIEITIKIKD